MMAATLGCDGGRKEAPAANRVPKEERNAAPKAPIWDSGQRYVYDAELASAMTVAGAPMMQFSLQARYVLEPRAVQGGVEFGARLLDTKFKVLDPETRPQFDALAAELMEPFAFTTAGGKLTQVRLHPGWSRFAVSISKAFAAALQFVERPGDQSGNVWTAREIDATGGYEAEYTSTAHGEIAKRKLRYEGLSLGNVSLGNLRPQLAPEVVESKGRFTFDPQPNSGNLLTGVDYREQLKTVLAPTSEVRSETTLRLALKHRDSRRELDWSSIVASTRSLRPDQEHGAPLASASFDAERIGNYTIVSALREIEEQARDPKRNELFENIAGEVVDPETLRARESKLQAHGRVFTALAALLRRDPKHLRVVVARVRAGSKATRALLDAVASAGTGEAQQALVSVMDDSKLGKGVRRAAAYSLSRSERATAATVAALKAHLGWDDFLNVHALYGLGTISRRLVEAGEPKRADAIARELVAVLEGSKSPAQQVHALRAIANSGNPLAFTAVEPLLGSKVAKVRAAAVDGLRLMQHPDVDVIVAERLGSDTDEVQLAALDAIAVRETSDLLARALEGAAASSHSAATRLKAVRLMRQLLGKRPEFRDALEQLAEAEANEQVRRAAMAAL